MKLDVWVKTEMLSCNTATKMLVYQIPVGGGATSRLSGKVGGSGPRLHQKGCTWTFCYTLLGIYGAAWVWGLAGTVALVFEGMEVIELAGSNFSFA